MEITVINLQSSIPVSISKIKSAARKIVVELNQTPTDISIVFVGSRRMRTINKKYLGHDYVTDVITFDYYDTSFPRKRESRNMDPRLKHSGVTTCGEIIICPQVALSNAKIHGVSISKELLLYVIHGFLHLAGYDDHKPQDIVRMRLKEKQLLGKLT